jgi:hypothetical protein
MNLVGKILTGIICFFCVILMAFVLAVYAAHTNWKNKATALQEDLQKVKTEVAELKTSKDKLTTDYAAEKKELSERLANLKSALDDTQKDRDALKIQKDDLEKKRTENEAAMLLTQKNCEALHAEVVDARKRIKDIEVDSDAKFKAMVKATDELNQKKNEYDALRARTTTLAQDLVAAKAVLLKLHVDPTDVATTPVADVKARVTAVRPDGYVQFDIGSDQGVRPGQQWDVVRKNASEATFLGRIQVVRTEPDRSVAKIMPEFLKGVMVPGDIVTADAKAKLQTALLDRK